MRPSPRFQMFGPPLPPWLTDIHGWTHVISAAQMLSASWSGSSKFAQSMAHSQAYWVSRVCALACWFANSFMHEVEGFQIETELMQTHMSRWWLGWAAHLEPLDASWPLDVSILTWTRKKYLPASIRGTIKRRESLWRIAEVLLQAPRL